MQTYAPARAIPTTYKGILFKSRLESQAALLMDLCGFKWEYEPESIMLSNGSLYTPDFYGNDGHHRFALECRGYNSAKGQRQIDGFNEEFLGRGFCQYVVIGPGRAVIEEVDLFHEKLCLTTCCNCSSIRFGSNSFPRCVRCEFPESDLCCLGIDVDSGKILVNGMESDRWLDDATFAGAVRRKKA